MSSDLNNWLAELNLGRPELLHKLVQFQTLFLHHNSQINLSAIRDREGFERYHLLDSLCAYPFLSSSSGYRTILDMGTGGGLPGLPLALALPDRNFVLLDATEKKILRVKAMIHELQVENAVAEYARVESWRQKASRHNQFDLLVSRAMSEMDLLFELGYPLLKEGGAFLFYQTADHLQRLSILEAVAGKYSDYKLENIPYPASFQHFLGNRTLILLHVIKKKAFTERTYAAMAKDSQVRHLIFKKAKK